MQERKNLMPRHPETAHILSATNGGSARSKTPSHANRLPKPAVPAQTADMSSWNAHMAKVPSSREPNEMAATATTRLAGYVVEALTAHDITRTRSVITWRYRLVREADGAVIFDCGQFLRKTVARIRVKKAIDEQFEVNRLKAEATGGNHDE